ncbi:MULTISPECIES: hypothetical protein [Thermincola]|uniref:hypothetical protein n=1 Tax=Thermincola TaxID=278993 RepID=UPI0012FD7870|nr:MULTISPECIES: hypothetical protein [Thermincola]
MVRRVVGRISREMQKESVDYKGPKTQTGARLRSNRTVRSPRSSGIGPYYRDE